MQAVLNHSSKSEISTYYVNVFLEQKKAKDEASLLNIPSGLCFVVFDLQDKDSHGNQYHFPVSPFVWIRKPASITTQIMAVNPNRMVIQFINFCRAGDEADFNICVLQGSWEDQGQKDDSSPSCNENLFVKKIPAKYLDSKLITIDPVVVFDPDTEPQPTECPSSPLEQPSVL